MQQLKFTTISQHEQLPEIPTRIILVIKNLNEFFSTGSIQGNTYTVGEKKKSILEYIRRSKCCRGDPPAPATVTSFRSKDNLNQNTTQ